MRRAGKKPLVAACPECGEPRRPHRVCFKCGVYNREKVIEIAAEEAE
jgi:large subunit ribosomal protein L32